MKYIYEYLGMYIKQYGRYRTELRFETISDTLMLVNKETKEIIAKGKKQVDLYLKNHEMILVDR